MGQNLLALAGITHSNAARTIGTLRTIASFDLIRIASMFKPFDRLYNVAVIAGPFSQLSQRPLSFSYANASPR